jgi:DNA ligase-1
MAPTGFKPNLAATLTKPELIKYPVYCSPKIDGIRCVVFDGIAYSRSLKPIPNPFVQAWATNNSTLLDGLDGELVVGSATDPNCMQNTTSGVMKKSGEPAFSFHAFDVVLPDVIYEERMYYVREQVRRLKAENGYSTIGTRTEYVPQARVVNPAALDHYEAAFLKDGYEGMMIRNLDGLYKYGRSTEREGGLVKVKRFTDAEAVVVGYVEEMANTNTATKDALGQTERSTAKAGLVGKGTLGALVVRDAAGREFNIGTGFTAATRRLLWDARDALVGDIVKYKSFDHGVKDAPRHPVFISFRHADDL